MEALLRGRPEHFRTVNSAVEWAVKASYIKNVDSARVSMPDQVVRCSPDDMDDPSMKWRIDLSASSCHWRGWFTGLSDLFLESRPAKMLLLAGMGKGLFLQFIILYAFFETIPKKDRLDPPLLPM